MSRPNRVNNQFYRKLRLNKSLMEVISHFRYIKKCLMAENEIMKHQQNKDSKND